MSTANVGMNIGMVANALLSRAALVQQMLDGEGRDLDKECRYPSSPDVAFFRRLYEREGVAKRVVRCLPQETWAADPEVFESENADETTFETAWKELSDKFNLLHWLYRIDELSGIGRFGVLLLGVDDGKPLSEPVEGVNEDGTYTGKAKYQLLYLRAFDESVVQVHTQQQDTSNPRYGQPTMYSITFQDPVQMGTTMTTAMVHWSRVIHVADNREMSEIYGVERLRPVLNRILDLRKTLGSSAEMFYKGGFPGHAFEVDPRLVDMGVTMDTESIKEEMALYQDGLQRFLAIQGVSAKSLAPQVADPGGHVVAQLDAIAISVGVPKRILFGSEQAQLASSQDARTWNKRLANRQDKYVTPMLIRPFVDRLIGLGILPEPVEPYQVYWPDLNALSDLERADLALKRTQALAAYVGASGTSVGDIIPPDQYLMQVLGMEQDEVDAALGQADGGEGTEDTGAQPSGEPGAPGAADGTFPVAPAEGEGLAVPLNGAQVQAAVAIVEKVTAATMPRDAAVGQLVVFFGLSEAQAERVLGTAGTDKPVKPNPGGPGEKPDPEPPTPPKGKPPVPGDEPDEEDEPKPGQE